MSVKLFASIISCGVYAVAGNDMLPGFDQPDGRDVGTEYALN